MQEQELIRNVITDLDVISLKPSQYVNKTILNVPVKVHRVTENILRTEYLLYIPTISTCHNNLYVLALYPDIAMPLSNKAAASEPTSLYDGKTNAQYIPVSSPLYKHMWQCLHDQQPFPVCIDHLELASCYLIEVY